MKMKRILIISEIFHPESGLVNDFAIELVRRGYKVEVLTHQPSYPGGHVYPGYHNDKYSVEHWNGIVIHRIAVVEGYGSSKLKKILNYRAFVRRGKHIAKRIGESYDCVFVYQTGPLTVALPGVYIKKKFKKPLFVWTFDIWPDAVYAYGFPRIAPLTLFLNHLIRKVYRNSDHILVSSRKFIESIRVYVADRPVTYAPNWLVEETHKVSGVRLDTSRFNFTFAGNISKAQNLENVLLGWAKTRFVIPVALNIIGEGSSLKSLRELVERRSIPNVYFWGRYPSDQVEDILRQSDVLVLPLMADPGIQKTEPFKLQTYLHVGKPIFGIAYGSIQDIVEMNGLGICAAPNHPDEIAAKFQEMVPFAEKCHKEVAERSRMLLLSRFDKEQIISRILSIMSK